MNNFVKVFDPINFLRVAKMTLSVESSPYLSKEEKLTLLQKKIKYVFVLFQANRSFDFYFGTYPGARGLFSQPKGQTPGLGNS
jgi:phospholipase C